MRLTPSWAAIEGGYAGKDAARANDPTVEDASWRERFKRCPYARVGLSFEQCEQAYCDGFDAMAMPPFTGSSMSMPGATTAGDYPMRGRNGTLRRHGETA